MMKLVELGILLFWLELKLGVPQRSKSFSLKNLGYLYQLTANHLRGYVCLWNDDCAERNGKGIQSSNYMSTKGLHNLGNYVWIYVS